MDNGTCVALGCKKLAVALDLCDTHYRRSRKGQPLDAPLRQWSNGDAARTSLCLDCGVEFECGSRGRKAERCPVHRPLRHQAMREAVKARRVECRHPDGCVKPAHADGWCSMHTYRIKRYGDAGPAGEFEPRVRYQHDAGYVLVRVGKGRKGIRYEHHVVMEEMLGRPLQEGEEVHHKNKVRDDNRPENLELWTVSQPPGARVADMVAYAVELLELYAPELLADRPTQLRIVA